MTHGKAMSQHQFLNHIDHIEIKVLMAVVKYLVSCFINIILRTA